VNVHNAISFSIASIDLSRHIAEGEPIEIYNNKEIEKADFMNQVARGKSLALHKFKDCILFSLGTINSPKKE